MSDESSTMPTPKTMMTGALVLIAAGGAGSVAGLTIEPAATTELRVENARLTERLDGLEALVEECRSVIAASRNRLAEEAP
jgi:hypothetical protein